MMGTWAIDGSARRRQQRRWAAIVPGGVLLLLVVGCGGNRVVPEPGAALLRITTGVPSPTPAPDELRVWAYDDGGRLWDGVRVPDKGVLGMASAGSYGTLLVQPGAIHGALRLHVRALASGARVMDGVASIAEALLGKDTVELRLSVANLPDGDGDDVPDVIDDCLTGANPAQGGCASAPPPSDAGAAADADASPGADADASPGADATGADATRPTDGAACADACGTPPPNKAIGQACTSPGQCISSFCADGVCCMSACGAACQSCSTGLCLPVKQAKDAPECAGTMTCNKKGDCVGA